MTTATSISDVPAHLTVEHSALFSSADKLPADLDPEERRRRLLAAGGGAYAVDAAIALLDAGELWGDRGHDREDPFRWAHQLCLRIAEIVDGMWQDGPHPILPRVIGGGAAVVIGGGRSALAVTYRGEIFAMRGTVPAEEWAGHWRRMALVGPLHGQYRLSGHAISAILSTPSATDREIEDRTAGDRSITTAPADYALDISLGPSCPLDPEGIERMWVGLPCHALSDRQADDVEAAIRRAWAWHWGECDRLEIERAHAELCGRTGRPCDRSEWGEAGDQSV